MNEREIDILAEVINHSLTVGCTKCGKTPDSLDEHSYKHHLELDKEGEIKTITHHCHYCLQDS